VAWLNSDDLYLDKAVSEAVASLERNPHVGMVYSNCLEIDQETRVTGWTRSRQFELLDILSFNIIPQPTVFLRRELVHDLGGLDPSLHYLFDHRLWTRVISSAPILYVDRYWAATRLHPKSKNTTRWADFGKEATRLLDELSTFPAIHAQMLGHENQVYAGVAALSANYALTNGDVRTAARHFARAIRLYPAVLQRCGLQLGVLALMGIGIIRPGRSFESLRRWRHQLTSQPGLPAIGQRLKEGNTFG